MTSHRYIPNWLKVASPLIFLMFVNPYEYFSVLSSCVCPIWVVYESSITVYNVCSQKHWNSCHVSSMTLGWESQIPKWDNNIRSQENIRWKLIYRSSCTNQRKIPWSLKRKNDYLIRTHHSDLSICHDLFSDGSQLQVVSCTPTILMMTTTANEWQWLLSVRDLPDQFALIPWPNSSYVCPLMTYLTVPIIFYLLSFLFSCLHRYFHQLEECPNQRSYLIQLRKALRAAFSMSPNAP